MYIYIYKEGRKEGRKGRKGRKEGRKEGRKGRKEGRKEGRNEGRKEVIIVINSSNDSNNIKLVTTVDGPCLGISIVWSLEM